MSERISWDDQRTFLAVLEEGSLSGAARRLGVSHPTVRSRIESLEAALKTVLFTRSVNGLLPTDSARALHEPARTMAMASDRFIRQASAPAGIAAGTVRISVPEIMGVEMIPRMLEPLLKSHSGLRVELSLSNDVADLLAQEVDVAVRTTAPVQSALVARKVASLPLGFFASRSYIDRRGMPSDMADLARHDLIGPDRNRSDLALAGRLWPDFTPSSFVLRTDNHPAQLAATRAGLGISALHIVIGNADPDLVRVLPGLDITTLETWIVMHEDLAGIVRVRAMFDALVAGYSDLVSGLAPARPALPNS